MSFFFQGQPGLAPRAQPAREAHRLGEALAFQRGRRTVPQIWINGLHVGGCDDLYALERAGELDPLLKAA